MTQAPSLWHSMSHSNTLIWFVAIFLSLSLHLLLFFQAKTTRSAVPDQVIQQTITHVRFANIAPPPPIVIEPPIEQPKPEPIVLPKPEPIQEKVMVEKKPEPIIKKQAKQKPKPTIKKKPKKKLKKKPQIKKRPKVVKKKPLLKQQPIIKAVAHSDKVPTKPIHISPVQAKPDPRLLEQTRKSYKQLVRNHIGAHKHYPRIARKRHIEGKIKVSFTLLADGSIKNLLINGKRSVLKKATKEAIANALPMPHPPAQLSMPMKIQFYMNYFLK